MSVGRQINWKGQMRVDVPHMRALESSIAYDFDTLAGRALAGDKPYILRGFTLIGTLGVAPTTWQMVTADSVVFHYTASENGTMLTVPSNRAAETLNTSNSRVTGGFTAGVDNYVGIDLIRAEDSTTSDIVQYVDATTLTATPKTVPLARTLDYRIVISSTPFTATTNVCPVAIVTVNASGNVTAVEDARTLYFRLAAGGVSPDPLGIYDWPQGRGVGVTPALENASFTGGDKAIGNEKDWKSAVMHRIWEVTGGEYWYSDTTDRNVKLACISPTTLADNIVADPDAPAPGTSSVFIRWEGLRIILSNSTASYNVISDRTGLPGFPDEGESLAPGECLYVDVDRYANSTITMVKGAIDDLNAVPPTRVGSRYVVVWCEAAVPGTPTPTTVYAWSKLYGAPELGRTFVPLATSAVTGIVRTQTNDQIGGFPIVVNLTTNGAISVTSLNAVAPAITGIGDPDGGDAGMGIYGEGGASVTNGYGGAGVSGRGGDVVDIGPGAGTEDGGPGLMGIGGASTGSANGGIGVYAVGNSSIGTGEAGYGVVGIGALMTQNNKWGGVGGYFDGGAATGDSTAPPYAMGGYGVNATGGYSDHGPGGHGVAAQGGESTGAAAGGDGVYAIGGAGTPGGVGVRAESSYRGVQGTGTNTAGSVGVYGTSSNATGIGVQGVSSTTGAGGSFSSTNGPSIHLAGTTTVSFTATPAEGDLWLDSTQNNLKAYFNGAWQNFSVYAGASVDEAAVTGAYRCTPNLVVRRYGPYGGRMASFRLTGAALAVTGIINDAGEGLSGGDSLFTIPAGYRPVVDVVVPICWYDDSGSSTNKLRFISLIVRSDGTVGVHETSYASGAGVLDNNDLLYMNAVATWFI